MMWRMNPVPGWVPKSPHIIIQADTENRPADLNLLREPSRPAGPAARPGGSRTSQRGRLPQRATLREPRGPWRITEDLTQGHERWRSNPPAQQGPPARGAGSLGPHRVPLPMPWTPHSKHELGLWRGCSPFGAYSCKRFSLLLLSYSSL